MNHTLSKEVANTGRALRKKIRRLEKGIEEREQSLLLLNNIKDIEHTGDLLKANFHLLKIGLNSITVTDWEKDAPTIIELNPKLSPKDQVAKYYKKVKKLKKSEQPLKTILSKLTKQLNDYQNSLEILSKISTFDELYDFQKKNNLFQKPKEKVHSKKINPYHTFSSESGHLIYVGKNAASNDMITFQMAKGDDLFLHLHGAQGAHVIIKKKRDIPIDQNTIYDAAQLALFFSKARGKPIQEHEVTIAEKRYVIKPKKVPGLASVSQHRTIKVVLDPNKVEEIKKRTVKK